MAGMVDPTQAIAPAKPPIAAGAAPSASDYLGMLGATLRSSMNQFGASDAAAQAAAAPNVGQAIGAGVRAAAQGAAGLAVMPYDVAAKGVYGLGNAVGYGMNEVAKGLFNLKDEAPSTAPTASPVANTAPAAAAAPVVPAAAPAGMMTPQQQAAIQANANQVLARMAVRDHQQAMTAGGMPAPGSYLPTSMVPSLMQAANAYAASAPQRKLDAITDQLILAQRQRAAQLGTAAAADAATKNIYTYARENAGRFGMVQPNQTAE